MPELLSILQYPDPFLRRPMAPVTEVTDDVRAMCERMIETMHEAHGMGLAAAQVGWDARIAVVSGTGERGDEIVLINPEITDAWGSEAVEEGCLSFPGVAATITRQRGIVLSFTGLDGEEYELEDDGMLARCCLHELDHLDGVTFLGKMTPADKLANRRVLKELEDQAAARTA